jgi:hypothetical protein
LAGRADESNRYVLGFVCVFSPPMCVFIVLLYVAVVS